jgi:hypothetical protein
VIALWLPAVKVDPETVPSWIVRLPEPTSVAEDAIVGLAMVCPWASVSTSRVEVPLPEAVPALTVATALLAICGVDARLPVVIIVSSELASVDIRFISEDESEIWVASVDVCVLSVSTWPEYSAADSSSARLLALMSPLTPSAVSSASVALPVEVVDVLAVDDVALVVELVVPVDELVEETVVIPERTTDRVAG